MEQLHVKKLLVVGVALGALAIIVLLVFFFTRSLRGSGITYEVIERGTAQMPKELIGSMKVIQSVDEWNQWWSALPHRDDEIVLPDIDFSTEVLLLLAPFKPSGYGCSPGFLCVLDHWFCNGYAFKVNSITKDRFSDAYLVHTAPSWFRGHGCSSTDGLIPFQILQIKNAPKNAQFELEF